MKKNYDKIHEEIGKIREQKKEELKREECMYSII